MRFVSYIRTSKGEKCSTPARQEGKIAEWCDRHGHELIDRYQDIGGTRSDDDNPRRRPDFARMLQDAKLRKCEGIVCEDQTRFGCKDVYAFIGYAGYLRKCKVQLWDAKNDKL